MQGRGAGIGLLLVALLVGIAGCGPCTVQGLNFCGRMLDAQSRPLRSGEANYRAIWTVDGVEYDSAHYGPVIAQIDNKGWACFVGGVGPTTVRKDFKLKSLTVQVTGETSAKSQGEASQLRWRYYSNSQELHASARFALAPERGILSDLVADEGAETDADAVVSGEGGIT